MRRQAWMSAAAVLTAGLLCAGGAGAVPPPQTPVVPQRPAPPEAPPAPPPELAETATVERDFHAAISEGDRASVAALLAEDAVIYRAGVAETKAAYLADHLAADIAFAATVKIEPIRTVQWADGEQAVFASEASASGQFNGQPVSRIVTETLVMRRTDAGWKIVHIHWSSRAVK